MKIYQYFRKDAEIIKTGDTLKDKYPIYALTKSKSFATLFEASHDMDKFIKKVYKGDDEECLTYLNRNRGYILDWYELRTYKKGMKHAKELYNVDVLMTDIEYDMISFSVENKTIIEELNMMVPPEIFKSKIFDALTTIGYTGIYHLLNGNEHSNFMSDMQVYNTDIEFDELLIFLNTHKDILKYSGVDLIIS